MDDFGTGYASLSGLQSFPFDKLKIDKTFVSGVESNAKSAEIVRAVIGLGRALKIPVIAEGVETAGERSFLMLEGCEELQGYRPPGSGCDLRHADQWRPRQRAHGGVSGGRRVAGTRSTLGSSRCVAWACGTIGARLRSDPDRNLKAKNAPQGLCTTF